MFLDISLSLLEETVLFERFIGSFLRREKSFFFRTICNFCTLESVFVGAFFAILNVRLTVTMAATPAIMRSQKIMI